jgi:anti-anti-sigma factor
MPLSVRFEQEKSQVTIEGTLDQSEVMKAWTDWKENLSSVTEPLVFDLTRVEKADTAGLAWLVLIFKRCRQHDIQVKKMNLPDYLKKLAAISDLDQILPIV